jgi:glucose-6-phosphate dehydrogenase assembly protein OpcA
MISTPDRQKAAEPIDEVRVAGARLNPACLVLV